MPTQQIIKFAKLPGIWDTVKGGFNNLISPIGKAMSFATGTGVFDTPFPLMGDMVKAP